MRRITVTLVLVWCLVVPFSGTLTTTRAQSQLPGEPLTNSEIVEMVRTKLSADDIVAKIKTSRCHFDTNPTVLDELRYKRVPEAVLVAMFEAPFGAPIKPAAEVPQADIRQINIGQPTISSSAAGEADRADVALFKPTSPEKNFNNNYWGTQGNINPYTGFAPKKKSRWKTALKWIGAGAVLGAMIYLDANSPSPMARCWDGTYSYSQHRRGTCSWHGGVMYWLR